MDVEGVVDALNHALRLQYRSALAYTVVAGSLVGLRFAPIAPTLAEFGRADLDDARRIVEKIVTLERHAGHGGRRGPLPPRRGARRCAWLLEIEEEAVEALQDCIPYTGPGGPLGGAGAPPRAHDHAQAGAARHAGARRARVVSPGILDCAVRTMAERRLHGLQRVLGVNALFSTAYGNVGSSIYYALGLVASYALGLTPVVFLITGVFFFCTAATYAEATAMYPEAGGSSSFARRAFNEFWSFFAAWAQMLNYIVTIAISAFFVPHYIGGLFWEPLRSRAGRHRRRRRRHRAARVDQRRRRQGVGGPEHRPRGHRLPDAGAARARRRVPRPLARRRSSRTSTSASRRRGRTSCWRSRSA